MAACSPQRFLAGNRNAIREAILDPSSVLPIADAVLQIPTARNGTAQVALTGDYDGEEEATYDVEIIDADVETPLVSAPVFTGEGSGNIQDISAEAIAQEFTVELSESGLPLLAAEIDFEGVTVKARTAGATGNTIHFHIDQSPLTFTPQAYSLLNDLEAGAGDSDSPLTGAEYDFDTAVLGAEDAIPAAAHRIAFGDDTSAIYLQYKTYLDGTWQYHFVPGLKRAVPKGTVINFVTGGRTVTVYPGSPAETYTDIVTLYDLLLKLQTESQLVMVEGVVTNDRTPDGQAAHELQTRTDAYFEPSSGDGSDNATGFEDVTVDADAGTQLAVATCTAVAATDHPQAHVGATRWNLKSSLLGDLGTIIEGEPFTGSAFGLTVPRRLPEAIATQVGNFTVLDIIYETRAEDAEPPPICPPKGERAGLLGPAAVDQVLTLVYTKRPTGDCACDQMPEAALNTDCLGNEGLTEGGTSVYQTDTIERIKTLREWFTTTVRGDSGIDTLYSIEDPYISDPRGQDTTSFGGLLSLTEVVDRFESTLALIDPLEGGSPSLRTDGCDAWDAAFEELQSDIASFDSGILQSFPSDRYVARLGTVLITAGISPLGGADANTISGDGCWRDWGDAYYWTVVGSEAGAYAPAFTNHPYWSSRRADDKKTYYSTHEFAFHIRVKCPEDLVEGDTISMGINAGARPAMYQVGDKLTLPIIGASDLYLVGGQDSSLVQSWLVNGSVAGPLPPYPFDPDAPAPYSSGSPTALSFLLVEGGIPFVNGDKFRFSVEGGHYRWRKNGGSWMGASPPEPIPDGATSFDSGLSITFTPGAAPSFANGDVFSFRALQPWAASNLQTPTVESWRWNEANPTHVFDCLEEQDMDMAAIALHTIPEGATITLEGGVAAGVYTWSESMTWRAGVIATAFSQTQTARYLRLSLTDATGGGIGWLWAGLAFQTSLSAGFRPRLSYKVTRGDGGLSQGGRFLGKSVSGDVEWQEGSLTEDDAEGVTALVDWVKEANDEPFVFLPQVTRPRDAFLAHILADEVELPDVFDYQPDASKDRRLSARLPLQGVWR